MLCFYKRIAFMKKYKFSYSAPVLLLIFAGMAVSVASIVFNVLRIVNNTSPTTYNYISLITVVLVCIGYLVLSVSMLVNSYYAIDDKYFILRWGILKNRLEIKSMTRVLLDSERRRLTVFYNEDNYFVVKSATIPFPDLVAALREVNKKIVFDFASNDKKTD